jgi:predicted dehydrogenase
VHCFDSLRYILQQEVTSVFASMHQDEQSGSVEANASIGLEFSGGALADVFVSTRAPYRTALEIIGSKRTLESRYSFYVDGPVEVVLLEEQREVQRVGCDNSRVYGVQFDAFSEALEGGKRFPCSGEDGLKNQCIIAGAYESARTGQKVRL